MKYFAGIDIGSTAIKVALVDEAGKHGRRLCHRLRQSVPQECQTGAGAAAG